MVYTSGYKQGSLISRLHAFWPDGTEKWVFETTATVRASPAIGKDGTVYFGGYSGGLYAVESTGGSRWVFDTDSSSVWGTPAVDHDRVYFGSGNYLYAISTDGELKWRFRTDGAVSSPAIDAERCIWFGSNDGHLYNLTRSGALKDKLQFEDLVSGSPVITYDGTIYLRDMHFLRALRGGPSGPPVAFWPMKRQNQQGTGCISGEATSGR
jgi:outer membrane protein assembly factor BamB